MAGGLSVVGEVARLFLRPWGARMVRTTISDCERTQIMKKKVGWRAKNWFEFLQDRVRELELKHFKRGGGRRGRRSGGDGWPMCGPNRWWEWLSGELQCGWAPDSTGLESEIRLGQGTGQGGVLVARCGGVPMVASGSGGADGSFVTTMGTTT
ncbi:hypothetical protein Dimus_033334, partial [Dionaea muscipula]